MEIINSIPAQCTPGEVPHFQRKADQPDHMLLEETSRERWDFHWKGKTLRGKWKLSLDFKHKGSYVEDRFELLHVSSTGVRACKATVPKFCCKLESPRKLWNHPWPRLHPKPITSESLGVGPRHQYFLNLSRWFQWGAKLEKHWSTERLMASELSKKVNC